MKEEGRRQEGRNETVSRERNKRELGDMMGSKMQGGSGNIVS